MSRNPRLLRPVRKPRRLKLVRKAKREIRMMELRKRVVRSRKKTRQNNLQKVVS